MKSTSASFSGCGSVNMTTSNALGSSCVFSAKSSEAGSGAGRGDPLEGEIERGGRAVRLMMAVEARQLRHRIDRRHEAGGLDDEDRRFVRQRQRVAAVSVRSPRRRARSRPARRRGPDCRRPRARAVAILEDERPRPSRLPRARVRPRRKRHPARRAREHARRRVQISSSLEDMAAASRSFQGLTLAMRTAGVKGRRPRSLCRKRSTPPDLPAVAQERVRQHAGDHRLADRHRADADARVVAALGDDLGLLARRA